jgi:hypothetical protein
MLVVQQTLIFSQIIHGECDRAAAEEMLRGLVRMLKALRVDLTRLQGAQDAPQPTPGGSPSRSRRSRPTRGPAT